MTIQAETTAPIIPYIGTAPSVTFDGGAFQITARSGAATVEIALSAATTAKLAKRLERALERYANGEQHIMES